MKKTLSIFIGAVAMAAVLLSCGTTDSVKGSGIRGNIKTRLVDYQGSTFNSEIPKWVKDVSEGNKTEIGLKKNIPGLEGKKAFVEIGRGDNLAFVKHWVETTEIEVAVGDEMQRVVGKAVSAVMQAKSSQAGDEIDETTVEQQMNMYKQAVSAVELNGLTEVASYWVQVEVLPADKKSVEPSKKYYEYYTVWAMDQKLYDKQIKKAMDSIQDNTDEGKALKEALSKKLQKMMITSNSEEVLEETEVIF